MRSIRSEYIHWKTCAEQRIEKKKLWEWSYKRERSLTPYIYSGRIFYRYLWNGDIRLFWIRSRIQTFAFFFIERIYSNFVTLWSVLISIKDVNKQCWIKFSDCSKLVVEFIAKLWYKPFVGAVRATIEKLFVVLSLPPTYTKNRGVRSEQRVTGVNIFFQCILILFISIFSIHSCSGLT